MGVPLQDLWSHEYLGAHEGSELSRVHPRVFAEAEIYDLGLQSIHYDIIWFEISMDDALGVHMSHC